MLLGNTASVLHTMSGSKCVRRLGSLTISFEERSAGTAATAATPQQYCTPPQVTSPPFMSTHDS
eukprot:5436248-Amphidinium_carterae.1